MYKKLLSWYSNAILALGCEQEEIIELNTATALCSSICEEGELESYIIKRFDWPVIYSKFSPKINNRAEMVNAKLSLMLLKDAPITPVELRKHLATLPDRNLIEEIIHFRISLDHASEFSEILEEMTICYTGGKYDQRTAKNSLEIVVKSYLEDKTGVKPKDKVGEQNKLSKKEKETRKEFKKLGINPKKALGLGKTKEVKKKGQEKGKEDYKGKEKDNEDTESWGEDMDAACGYYLESAPPLYSESVGPLSPCPTDAPSREYYPTEYYQPTRQPSSIFPFFDTEIPTHLFCNIFRKQLLYHVLVTKCVGDQRDFVNQLPEMEAWEFCDKNFFLNYFDEMRASYASSNTALEQFTSPLAQEVIKGILQGLRENELPANEVTKLIGETNKIVKDINNQLMSTGKIAPTTETVRPTFTATAAPSAVQRQPAAPGKKGGVMLSVKVSKKS